MQEAQVANPAVPVGKLLNDEITALAERYGIGAVKFAAWNLPTRLSPVKDADEDQPQCLVERTRVRVSKRVARVDWIAELMEAAIRGSSVPLKFGDVIASAMAFDQSIKQDEAIACFYDRISGFIARLDDSSNVILI